MSTLELSQLLGNYGEFFGAIAVVATLGYLVVQIKQNTSALRGTSRLEIANSYRENNRLLANARVARAYSVGMGQYPNMQFEERSLFSMYMNDFGVFIQGARALHDEGQLEEATYKVYLTSFCTSLSTPGGSAWWVELKPFYLEKMVDEVDQRLALGGFPVPDILDLAATKLDD